MTHGTFVAYSSIITDESERTSLSSGHPHLPLLGGYPGDFDQEAVESEDEGGKLKNDFEQLIWVTPGNAS